MISPACRNALGVAALEPEPSSLGAAGRLRTAFRPEEAARATLAGVRVSAPDVVESEETDHLGLFASAGRAST